MPTSGEPGSREGFVGLWDMSHVTNANAGVRRVYRTRAINPGPGSYRLLAVLGRLGVAGIEPLARMLGISIGTTYSHVRRLERAGLVWRVPVRDGGGGTVAIARKGATRLRDDGHPAVAAKSQVPSTAEHSRAVSWLAAQFELRDGLQWLGPAELRGDRRWRIQRSDGAGHLPDVGVLFPGGGTLAIEVELHSKANDRLRSILSGYRWHIDRGLLLGLMTYLVTGGWCSSSRRGTRGG